jgi:O-acetyl-ADP-ribose deacetylase (regulator of RNase III)
MIPPAGLGSDIVRHAGSGVLAGLKKMNLGDAVRTDAGNLRSTHLLHVAVSSLSAQPSLGSLEDGLNSAFGLCRENEIASVAIPLIAIGVGQLPVNAVAQTTVRLSMESLRKSKIPARIVIAVPTDSLDKVIQSTIKRMVSEPY